MMLHQLHQPILLTLLTFLTPPLLHSNSNFHFQAQALTSHQIPYAVNLRVQIQPQRRTDFLNLIRQNQKLTLETESDALQYVVGEDVDTPNVFYIHEQFLSAKAFDVHRDTDHAKEWAAFKATGPFLDSSLDFYYCANTKPCRRDVRELFGVHVQVFVKKSRCEEFLKVIDNSRRKSLEVEDKCLQYVYGSCVDYVSDDGGGEEEDCKFVLHEEYTSQEGFVEHTQTDHFKVWEEFVESKPFTKDPVISLFETI